MLLSAESSHKKSWPSAWVKASGFLRRERQGKRVWGVSASGPLRSRDSHEDSGCRGPASDPEQAPGLVEGKAQTAVSVMTLPVGARPREARGTPTAPTHARHRCFRSGAACQGRSLAWGDPEGELSTELASELRDQGTWEIKVGGGRGPDRAGAHGRLRP